MTTASLLVGLESSLCFRCCEPDHLLKPFARLSFRDINIRNCPPASLFGESGQRRRAARARPVREIPEAPWGTVAPLAPLAVEGCILTAGRLPDEARKLLNESGTLAAGGET